MSLDNKMQTIHSGFLTAIKSFCFARSTLYLKPLCFDVFRRRIWLRKTDVPIGPGCPIWTGMNYWVPILSLSLLRKHIWMRKIHFLKCFKDWNGTGHSDMTSPLADPFLNKTVLDQSCNVLHALASKEHDRRYIDQCMAPCSHTGNGARTGDQYL